MNTTWKTQAKGNLRLVLEGQHRVTNRTVNRTVEELLAIAQASDGVFGSDNRSVSAEMTIRQIADWHADYNWTLGSIATK